MPEVPKLLRTFAMICRKIIAFKFVETPEAGAFIQTRPKPKLSFRLIKSSSVGLLK